MDQEHSQSGGFGSRGVAGGRGRGGRGRGRGGRGRGGAPNSAEGKSRPQAKPEKYVVVISNVENDFARVHEACLGAYLSLCPKQQQTSLEKDKALCTYDITCRSETRSAEVRVSGPADAPVSSIFKSSNNNKKKTAVDSTDPTSPDALAVEESTTSNGAAQAEGYASLEDMAAVLSHRPYFTHAPRFHVNLPGKEAGEIIHTTKAATTRKPKRAREEGEGDDAAEEAESKKAHAEGSKAGAEAEDEADSTMRQFASKQADLVSAVAAVSARWNTRELRRHFKDLPGFLSCWAVYAKHFRVVFQDKTSLFKAKQLLDQFQIDGSVRVSLNLSDALSRSFGDFVAEEQAVEVAPVEEL